jgi:hypothetical protein
MAHLVSATIWEDAVDAGLVVRRDIPGHPAMVQATVKGTQFLAAHRGFRAAQPVGAAE